MKKRQTLTTLQTIVNHQIPNFNESTSDTISQEKIKFRQKRVNQLKLRGYTNEEVAVNIGCSLSTVEKDMHDINELSRSWFEEESIEEFCQSLYDSIILCDNAIEDLQIIYTECNDVSSKLMVLSKISEFEERKTTLYKKTKAVQDYFERLKL